MKKRTGKKRTNDKTHPLTDLPGFSPDHSILAAILCWVHKLTPERHLRVISALRDGNYRQVAAALAGVDRTTLYRWLERGRTDADAGEDTEFAALYRDAAQAEAEFEDRMIKMVAKHAESGDPQTWQAAMTLLERKYPDRYGRRDTTIIEGGERPVLAVSVLQDESVSALANALLRRLGEAPAAGAIESSGNGLGDQLQAGDPAELLPTAPARPPSE